jgi:hypothetical protein
VNQAVLIRPAWHAEAAMITLHEELLAILASHGNRWMPIAELAKSVNARRRYLKRDGSAVEPSQIHLRTRAGGSYEHLFERQGLLVRARLVIVPTGSPDRQVALRSEIFSASGASPLPAATPGRAESALQAALVALGGQRWSLAGAPGHIPSQPGLYAIYGDAVVWASLGLGSPPDDRPLYVGKSESSLADRDLRTHFGDGRTGSSTVRRSFAALLHDSLELRGIPRNPARPERFANYGLAPDDDARLTAWMRKSLRIAVWPTTAALALGAVEVAVLRRLQPPLNLKDVATPWAPMVKAARAEMAGEATRWAASSTRPHTG